MFARFSTLFLIVISAVLLFSSTVDATINVDYVGPGSGNLNYGFTGDTLYGQVSWNEPYGTVYWYLKVPGDTGMGTIVSTDNGDGVSTTAYFSHTFNSGSTSGKEYKITAYVYLDSNAADQSVDWDSWTVSVWTPLEEVITTPDELTITDDIKIGDSYSFNVDATSSSSNYGINEIEVLVDGVSKSNSTFDCVTTARVPTCGYLSHSAGAAMNVEVSIKCSLLSGLKTLGKFTLTRAWHGVLRGTVKGFCECIDDGNDIDSQNSVSYTYQDRSQSVTKNRRNRTRVRWSVRSPMVCEDGIKLTNNEGKYSFIHKVPFGHDVTMWIRGDDLHNHGFHQQICKYEANENLGVVGKVVLVHIPVEWGACQWVYKDTPVATYDPSNNPYPISFKDNWKFD